MGYFRKKIDRGRARAEKLDLASEPYTETWLRWSSAAQPVEKGWFVRFSVPDKHDRSKRRKGVFAEAYDLLESKGLSAAAAEELQATLHEFGRRLAVPDIDEEAAIFFFKGASTDCLPLMWELAAQIRAAGRHVEFQKVAKPGRIVYEDDDQVAAVPWAESTGL